MLVNEKKDRCAYLIEHEKDDGFDEITYCPRHLNSDDKKILIDYMSECVLEYGQNLQDFMFEYPDVDYSPYFDRFYHLVMRSIRMASRALHLRENEESF